MKYMFAIDIVDIGRIPFQTLETMSGEVEADRSSHASLRAWPLIHARVHHLRAEGYTLGAGDLHVEQKHEGKTGVDPAAISTSSGLEAARRDERSRQAKALPESTDPWPDPVQMSREKGKKTYGSKRR